MTERQQDYQTGEWKYLVLGQSLHGIEITVVGKLSVTDMLVIITVYREDIA